MSEPHSLMPKRRKRNAKPKDTSNENSWGTDPPQEKEPITSSSGWNDGSSRSDKTPPREKIEKLITPSSGWNDGSRNSTRSSESRSRIDGPSRRKREYHSNGGHSSGGQYNSGGRSSPVESVISVLGVENVFNAALITPLNAVDIKVDDVVVRWTRTRLPGRPRPRSSASVRVFRKKKLVPSSFGDP